MKNKIKDLAKQMADLSMDLNRVNAEMVFTEALTKFAAEITASPRCPRCGSGNPDTYLALANGEVCLHAFHEPTLQKLAASRVEVAEPSPSKMHRYWCEAHQEWETSTVRVAEPSPSREPVAHPAPSVVEVLQEARHIAESHGYSALVAKIDAVLATLKGG
jgi:hypothetical protein